MRRAFDANDDAFAIHRIHDAGALVEHHGAGIAGRDAFHTGAHVRSVGAEQRHGLALHVGTHQRAVGVVVFQERNQAGGHRDELLGADVDVFDLVAALEHEVAGLAGVGKIGNNAALLVQFHVGLGDGPLVFFPRREVLAVGFEFDALLLGAELAVDFFDFGAAQNVADLRSESPGFRTWTSSTTAPLITLRYGLSMKPYSLMRAKHDKRRDQADVRPFRRFDGADAAVVRGVHVADFESGALAA